MLLCIVQASIISLGILSLTNIHSTANTPDKRRIVMEYFEFALSLRYANIATSVIQALLTGIDIILNVSYQHQEKLLLQDYTLQLASTKEWLEGNDPYQHVR